MNDKCLFCQIANGAIPAQKVFENEQVIAFIDIHPQAKLHLLFIHKKHTENINEMISDELSLLQLFRAISEYTKSNDLHQDGFRIVTNQGRVAGQSVFHTHFHLIGGQQLGSFGR